MGEEEEEDEGEDDDEDEYEDELKAIAESHEAMSKDEARNSNVSSAGDDRAEGKLSGVKNFDSHEKSNENMSDEDVASNEAIGGYDMEDDAQDDEVRNVIFRGSLSATRSFSHNSSRSFENKPRRIIRGRLDNSLIVGINERGGAPRCSTARRA